MNLHQMIDQFDLVTDTEDGLEQLRYVILYQAVRGNLTSNVSTNGTANELLETIKAEKVRQKDKGLITRIPKVDHSEEWPEKFPEYPDGWLITKLGNVLNLEYGKGLPTKKRNTNGSYPVFGSNGPMDNHDEYLVEAPCLVIGRKGSAGAINLTYQNCWPTDVTYFVNPTNSIDIKYSYYLLESLGLEELSKGIKPGLNRNEAYELFVGIPPLEIQCEIVNKIEILFSQVDELEQKVRQDRGVDERLQVAVLDDLQRAETPEASRRSWQRLTDNLEQVYRKPEHIDQLKQAILNEAVRGRLVPQDSSDEPAKKLLEHIKVEKQRLYEEGEIRKPKDLDPVSDDEVPYQIPTGWCWERLGNLVILERGRSKYRPRNADKLFKNGTYPFIQTGDVANSNGRITEYSKKYNEVGLKQSKLWSKGTLCITIAANIADTGILRIDACFPDSIVGLLPVIRPDETVKYYDYFIQNLQSDLEEFAPSTAQKNINLTILNSLLCPVPPLEEQVKIVNKVRKLLAWCDDLKSTLSRSQQTDQRLLEALVNGVSKNEQVDSNGKS